MSESQKQSSDVAKHQGSCHCGAVRFEVAYDPSAGASRCNCSICTKTAILGAIVKPNAFTLLTSEGDLGWYEWGGKTARRFFCKTCGVQCFGRGYLEQVGGDYVSFNVNCLDDLEIKDLNVVYWDGRHDNWEAGPRPAPWAIHTRA
ncbi:GFA family protein [Pendulispora albinea]|uniref:GFA family protein n=1 Tax=Pendulispora albinea TaxID=2741071 RepID=A0ABZ2M295_9BACT